MSLISLERADGIATLMLMRAEAANALSRAMLEELTDALASLAADEGVRAVIVTAAGDKVFCAGADLKERSQMTPDEALKTVTMIRETISAVAALPMPVIAAINGAAMGGGTELALACDIRLAATTAKLGLTETTLAIIPGGGGTQRLARLVGAGRAKELIFTGRRISAAEALGYGIVEEVCAPEDLRVRALEIARTIARNGPIAVRAAKQAIDRGADLALADALKLETSLYEKTLDTKDRMEGLTAFAEKRPPVYRGE